MTNAKSTILEIIRTEGINAIYTFSDFCRTCLTANEEHLDEISVELKKLNLDKSENNELYLSCPEVDFRIFSNAILCKSCYELITIISQYVQKFTKIKEERGETESHIIDIEDFLKEIIMLTGASSCSKDVKKPFKCPQCEYCTSEERPMNIHALVHSNAKPYKCLSCSYSTSKKTNLYSHVFNHAGEKPFKCPHCDYRSAFKCGIKYHVKLHFGKESLKCPYCYYRTVQPFSLNAHLHTHSKEKQYMCSVCDYRSTYRCGVKSRLKQQLHSLTH